MVYPNNSCYLFCVWLLTSSYQKFSTSRTNLIITVQNAANTGGSVTTSQWNFFIYFTNPYLSAYNQNVSQQ